MNRHRAGQDLEHLIDDATERAVYVVSVAAELAGMRPQTLRRYDRLKLVGPARTRGQSRHYSHRDVECLRRIQSLPQEGINLEGICCILTLKARVEELEADNARMRSREAIVQRISAAAADGEVQAVVPGCQGHGPAPHHLGAERAHVVGTTGGAGTALVPVHQWY